MEKRRESDHIEYEGNNLFSRDNIVKFIINRHGNPKQTIYQDFYRSSYQKKSIDYYFSLLRKIKVTEPYGYEKLQSSDYYPLIMEMIDYDPKNRPSLRTILEKIEHMIIV